VCAVTVCFCTALTEIDSFSDPQVISLNHGHGYLTYRSASVSLQQAVVTGLVPTGHDSVRCLLYFSQLAALWGMSNTVVRF